MQIRIPTRDCRAAVETAIEVSKDKLASDRKHFEDRHYTKLREGAVHNGTVVTEEVEKKMREMINRDLDATFEGHPCAEVLQQLELYRSMLAYTADPTVVIDDAAFSLLQPHLPHHEEVKVA